MQRRSTMRHYKGLVPSDELFARNGYEVRAAKESVRLAKRLKIDSELLALFVEMAAFQTKRPGYVGHVEIVALNFSEEHFPLESFRAF
jgi:hypothetical protein